MRLTLEEATRLQRDAADPSAPRIVNANAGSGKTKVLVDRVSRILLQGTDPDKILCLTYTRAAASEMQERLFKTLSSWSVAPDDTLKRILHDLYGKPFETIRPPLDIDKVRTLFARALETPEGLKVMTIHAFCERIIGRFPIEAGIMPGFSTLDDVQLSELLSDARTELLKRAKTEPELQRALRHLTRLKADATLDAMLFSVARDLDRTERWVAAGGLSEFRVKAGLTDEDTVETVARKAMDAVDRARTERIFGICDRVWTSSAGVTSVQAYRAALVCEDPEQALTAYAQIFLTKDGKLRKKTLVAAVHKEDPFLANDSPECDRVVNAMQTLKAARLVETTEAILTLGHALGLDLALDKHAMRGLDYSDLILKTRDLLKRRDVSDWVAYKLDGGIEHVLLDEAQDTSPDQWEIINAITDPFSQDSPDREGLLRTFFAVGDPKQSIYRFQGAAPIIFLSSVKDRAGDHGEVRLRMSFRSTQQVLDVVDNVFLEQGGLRDMFDEGSFPDDLDLIRHSAHREDTGLVELWPLSPKADGAEDREPWDTTPVDAQGEGDPRLRLATEIAGTIRHWIDSAEPIFDRELGRQRPMHAGDVLILVQKRVGGLFDAIIRALKVEDIPVAGADRLILQEALIVRDLLALTRFILLPSDCLSLAEALKSPLFDIDDDRLFDLCVDRADQSLWKAVHDRSPELAGCLETLLADADQAPYDFYVRLLDRTGPHGLTYREALYRRLGMESKEALDAFLAIALDHQQKQAPSLQRFLQAFVNDTVEIKRDQDHARREVRVMTVHGAKGLEAPIVFLPDTTRAPTAKSGGLIRADGGFILAPSKAESFPLADAYKEEDHAEQMREYMRLLYVAMTRAETRLVICGHWSGNSKTGFAEDSWYPRLVKTLDAMESETFATAFDGMGRQGLRYGRRELDGVEQSDVASETTSPLPDWIKRSAKAEGQTDRTLNPSSLLEGSPPSDHAPGGGRIVRGIVVHRLLEILPDHPVARRRELARNMVEAYPDFVESERDAIIDEVFSVLEHPDFVDVFAEGSRAEVGLAGRVQSIHDGTVFLTAQVDRLSMIGDAVYLVDYKSSRTVPDQPGDVDATYLAQMAAYRELAKAIWPDHEVRCGLLWTRVPMLMWLDDRQLDAVLTQVNRLPTSR